VFLLAPKAKHWLPADGVVHVVAAAVERVPFGAFSVRPIHSGKAQYHPRLLLALLIDSSANGIFSPRRIERATHRDVGVRCVAANLHPDHDTIAALRRLSRVSRAGFQAAFLQVLLARRSGLLQLGTVAIDGSRINLRSRRWVGASSAHAAAPGCVEPKRRLRRRGNHENGPGRRHGSFSLIARVLP
jgi:transposase